MEMTTTSNNKIEERKIRREIRKLVPSTDQSAVPVTNSVAGVRTMSTQFLKMIRSI
jgi:hypothetical protein